jgi:hypothetical protein
VGGRALRTSHPTLAAASRAITAQREALVEQWIHWLGDRMTVSNAVPDELIRQELALLIDVFGTMVGPLRRETKSIWLKVTEEYGRHAAVRGLAAGEVVEELQYLRELLIRFLAPSIAALRPRQGMALLLRLNRLVDRGVTMAVVGYTDALVASLLPEVDDGRPGRRTPDPAELSHALTKIRAELIRTISISPAA